MKKIFWIDDDVSSMKNIVIQLFPELWDKGFSNQIIFVGDNYREENPKLTITDTALKKFDEVILNRFQIYCLDGVNINDPNLCTPLKVWNAKKNDLCPSPSKPVKIDEDIRKIEDIAKKIEEIIEKGACIGLDVRLFIPDAKLKNETLAMHLFHSLSKAEDDGNKKYKVFLYTIFWEEPDLEKKWGQAFKEIYPNFQGDIRIFSRNKLTIPKGDGGKEKESLFSLLEGSGGG
jgi:hypothetical protein